MKTIINLFFVIAIFAMMSCSSSGSNPEEVNPLLGTWKVNSISRDNVNMSDYYTDFRLTLSEHSYTTSGRPDFSPFMSGGNFSQTDVIMLFNSGVDQLSVDYDISDNTLHLHFQFSGEGYPGGRVEHVSGNWTISLSKI